MKCLLALGIALLTFSSSRAGVGDSTYDRVITERAGRIVISLGLPDSTSFYRVRTLIADQYRALNVVYTERDSAMKLLKAENKLTDSAKKNIELGVDTRVSGLHTAYLTKLSKVLSPEQVDKVKDGMTYSVLEVTYKAYQDELPGLTEEQKKYIMAALVEAREHAMDAESSKKKHDWFGKYKGRINNYLSTQGYDMKKAGEEWQKRRQAAAGGADQSGDKQ